MFHTSFDDLEMSLEATLQGIKKSALLKEAAQASKNERHQGELRDQLEDQATLLNRIKDHHREIRSDERWPTLEAGAKIWLNMRTLFNEEQRTQYLEFKHQVNQLINSKKCEIDTSLNSRIIERGQEKAGHSKQVKSYKNWTTI